MYTTRPAQFTYHRPATVDEAVALLAEWGATRQGRTSGPRHESCGAALELRPWCPTCEIAVATTPTMASHAQPRSITAEKT